MINMQKKEIIIGVDGGATSTKCILTNLKGQVLARSIAGPSNQGFMNERKIQLRKALTDSLKPAFIDKLPSCFCASAC